MNPTRPGRIAWIAFVLLGGTFGLCAPTAAQHVVQTIGADSEVHDVAALGDRTLLATSGGLLVVRQGRVVQRLGVADGLPGARLRSVSVLASVPSSEGAVPSPETAVPSSETAVVFVGAVEGLAELEALPSGVLRVVRSHDLRRVRRVVSFGGSFWAAGYAGLSEIARGDGAVRTTLHELGASHARTRLTDVLVVGAGEGAQLWVASAGAGILRLDRQGAVVGRVNRTRGLRHDHVWDLEAHEGNVLVGTLDGLSVVRARDAQVLRTHALSRAAAALPVRDVRRVVVSSARAGSDPEVYAVTYGGGARSLESRSPESTLRAFSAAVTHEGLVVGHRVGANVVGGRALVEGGLPSADVTALAHAFGKVWIGTFDRGLATMRNGRIEAVERASSRYALDGRVNDLAVTGRGRSQRLWIATDRGLYWHDGRRFAPVDDARGPGRQHVTSMHVDARGDVWVTSSRVLSRWTHATDRWQNWDSDAGFPVAQLHAVTTRREGGRLEVWVGSLHGLYRFDPATGRAQPHTVATGDLPVDWVTALSTVGGQLVAGTYHGGLSWRVGDRFRIESERHGLPAGWVNPHAMQNIDGALWVGTLERGLLIGRRGAWTHLRVAQGLPSDDVTDVLEDGNGVWVATRAGLARIER